MMVISYKSRSVLPMIKFASVLVCWACLALCVQGRKKDVSEEQKTGFFYNQGATDGLTLFAPGRGTGTYLVGTDGNVVHSWDEPDGLTPGLATYLTKDGTLLRAVRTEGGGGQGGRVREYDLSGKCIWELRYDNNSPFQDQAPGQQHHDFEIMPNGNLLITAREGPNDTLVEVKRRNPDGTPTGYENTETCPATEAACFNDTCEHILDGAADGFVPVWKWNSADHRGDGPYKISTELPAVNFNHVSFLPGRNHILLSYNSRDEIYIIDRDLSTEVAKGEAGDLLWRWGSPSNYNAEGEKKIAFTHSADWIYDDNQYGWSGYSSEDVGSIIFVNNRDPRLCDPETCISPPGFSTTSPDGFSSIIMLTPPWDGESYGTPTGTSAFGPPEEDFYMTQFRYKGMKYDIDSNFQGSAQYLPNGRIVMAQGTSNNNESTGFAQGDMYELRILGKSLPRAVWRYVNPFIPPEEFWDVNNGPKPSDVELEPDEPVALCDQNNVGIGCNSLFKASKYSPDFEGFSHWE